MNKPTRPSRYDRYMQQSKAEDQFRVEQLKEQKARQENTARLKALRLAKEAADKAAADAIPKPVPRKAGGGGAHRKSK